MSNSAETASTLVVGAVGMTLPQFINTWGGVLITLLTIIWLSYKIYSTIKDDLYKWKKRKEEKKETLDSEQEV